MLEQEQDIGNPIPAPTLCQLCLKLPRFVVLDGAGAADE